MTNHPVRARALDEAGRLQVHEATLSVLEKTGVEVRHERALELLRTAGAKVEGTRVRIPRQLVDEALLTAPDRVELTSRSPGSAGLTLEAGATYYGTGSDCLHILGPGARDRRSVSLDDVEEMAALQERLPNIDFVMSMAHPHELDARVAPLAQFAAMLRGTSKPLIMVPELAGDLDVFHEMAEACGSKASWSVYAMPTSPLVHGEHSADRLVRCADLGVPMVYASAILQGATAPASRAGSIVLTNAEMLSGLVIAQLANAGAPFVYGVTQGGMNPRTAHVVYCGPETMAEQQATADMAFHYDLPSFGYGGCTDSLLLDEQWALEAGLTLLTAAMAGVTLLHDIGYAASGTASAYEAVVAMDEAVAWVKAYLEGIALDSLQTALDEIDAVGPGGSYLSRKHTRSHLRDYLVPDLISQDQYETWKASGGTSLLDRTAEKTAEVRSSDRGYRLSEDATAALETLLASHGRGF